MAWSSDTFNVTNAERAQSSYNFPNVFTALWVYDPPFRHQQSGFLGHVMGGWKINGTYRYTSGQPYTIEQNAQPGSLCDPTNFTGGALDACRPILSKAGLPFDTVGQYCDGTGVTCPAAAIGTTGLPFGTLASINAGCVGSGGSSSQCAVTPITGAHWIVKQSDRSYHPSPDNSYM
jgi:hypothetical protein